MRTTFTNRANCKFINTSIYLSGYKLKVFYIPRKLNFILNALSRLKAIGNTGNPEGILVLDDVWEDSANYFKGI